MASDLRRMWISMKVTQSGKAGRTHSSLLCNAVPKLNFHVAEHDESGAAGVGWITRKVTQLGKSGRTHSSLLCHAVPKLNFHVVEHDESGAAGDGRIILNQDQKVGVAFLCLQCSCLHCNESVGFQEQDLLHRKLSPPLEEGTGRMLLARLLLWYLDPLALKHDISRVLSEVVERPFLCLKKEFHGRMAWHSIIICLVTSPSMFIETRALLHSWFLATGVASILELCIEIIFSVLDALARPMWWGMSLELGLKLPFSHAYFPSKHHELLARLTGPISCESFLDLVQLMTWPDAQTESLMSTVRPSYGIFRETAAEVTMVDHKSMWGMLMHFPAWFYFAAMLLFCAEELDPFQLKCTRGAVKTGGEYGLKLHYAASRYLAWILSPVNECHYDMLLNFITEISSSWTLKRKGASQSPSCSSSQNNDMVGRSKKLKKSKNDDNNKRENIVLGIDPWLKDFQGCYIKYYNRTETIHVGCELPNLLFRRIPLGILVGCSRYLDEKGYDLLLHYASTGKIHGSRGTHYTGTKHAKPRSTGYDSDDLNRGSEEIDGRKDIIAGTSLVFGLFDVIEDMSASMFDSEEDRWEFVSLGKGKAGKYLVNCIKKLLELQSYEDEGTKVMLKDLSRRLTRWSQLGEETFEGHKAFNDAVNDLNFRISSTMKRV